MLVVGANLHDNTSFDIVEHDQHEIRESKSAQMKVAQFQNRRKAYPARDRKKVKKNFEKGLTNPGRLVRLVNARLKELAPSRDPNREKPIVWKPSKQTLVKKHLLGNLPTLTE